MRSAKTLGSVLGSLAFGLCVASAAAPPAPQMSSDVDLELVIAVDVSASIDHDELLLQRRGYVEALRHPDVVRAILSGRLKRIAVTYVEWSGRGKSSMSPATNPTLAVLPLRVRATKSWRRVSSSTVCRSWPDLRPAPWISRNTILIA